MKGKKMFGRMVVLLLALALALSACQFTPPPPPVARSSAPAASAIEARIANAMSAGPSVVSQEATILDYPEGWPHNWPDEPAHELVQLRAGSNGWTCIPDDPTSEGNDPLCVNEVYMQVIDARQALVDSPAEGIGIGYMLQEGRPAGSSPHMMIFVPGSKESLSAFSTSGGPTPWVMFPDTTHAHLMVTVHPQPDAAPREDRIANAMSAGPPAVSQEARILDYPEGWPHNWPNEPAQELVELRAGNNGWTCIPDDPTSEGNDPLCVNEVYMQVLDARRALVDSPSEGIGIGYMLQEGRPAGSQPHMMIFVPGSKESLGAFSTAGGPIPWVMFPETTHAHLMATMHYLDK